MGLANPPTNANLYALGRQSSDREEQLGFRAFWTSNVRPSRGSLKASGCCASTTWLQMLDVIEGGRFEHVGAVLETWMGKRRTAEASDGKPIPTKTFEINPDRLTKQVIYFTVTAQIVNFALEVIVPYAKRKFFRAVKEVQSEIASKHGHPHQPRDSEEEAAFLARVRNEAELDEYDVTVDYREMVVQFGKSQVEH